MKTKNKKVLVLLSGGADSSAVAYNLYANGYEVHALSINYGNRAQIELEYAKRTADKICESYEVLELKNLRTAFVNPDGSVPKEAPFRNNIMLSIAASYAWTRGIYNIAIGAHKDDYERLDATYFGDCTMDALLSTVKMLNISSPGRDSDKPEVNIISAVDYTKLELLESGIRNGLPVEDIMSCYKPIDGKPCNECESCKLLNEAIKEIEVKGGLC